MICFKSNLNVHAYRTVCAKAVCKQITHYCIKYFKHLNPLKYYILSTIKMTQAILMFIFY